MALALTTDGVGTKMLVADQMQDWSTVGIDCIAMNVNDLYVMNLEPVAFVDYIATDILSVEKMAQIGIGLNEGAKQANIDIVGGETASLRGLVNGLDLAGTCLGMQKKDKIVTGEKIKPGDVIIGVASTGCPQQRALTRPERCGKVCGLRARSSKGRKTLGQELLTPTRIYHESLKVAAGLHEVHGHVPRHRWRSAEFHPAEQVRIPLRYSYHTAGDFLLDPEEPGILLQSKCTAPSTWVWGMRILSPRRASHVC